MYRTGPGAVLCTCGLNMELAMCLGAGLEARVGAQWARRSNQGTNASLCPALCRREAV